MADPAWFWGAAADDLEVHWQRRPAKILDLGAGGPRARWWIGGAFNHAVAATEPWAAASPDDAALAWESEDGQVRRFTWSELDREVRLAARRLAAVGVGEGTRVGILLPMLAETAIAVLALGRLRAIFTPIFSGYAAPAIAARLNAFEASHLITADGFLRRGAVVALKAVADEAVGAAPSVRTVVVVRRFGRAVLDVPMTAGRDVEWSPESRPDAGGGASAPGVGAPAADLVDDVPPTDPETPYMVIYTSGTTGQPKGTVHVHGGFPIKAAQDLAHTFDLRRGDGLCWFTDLGWMMGPWAISGALLLGARLVLYEGASGLARPRAAVVAGRAPPDHPLRREPDADPGAPGPRRGTRPRPRPGLAAGARLDRRAVEPRPVAVVLRRRGRRPPADRQLLAAGPRSAAGSWAARCSGRSEPTSFNGPCVGMAADIVDAEGRSGPRRRRRAGHPAAAGPG